VEALTREQVQEVYEALERLIEQRQATARAANA
jgi:hypothetical protein